MCEKRYDGFELYCIHTYIKIECNCICDPHSSYFMPIGMKYCPKCMHGVKGE